MMTRRMLGLLGLLLSACAGPQRAATSEPPPPAPEHSRVEVEPKVQEAPEPPPPPARVSRKAAKAPTRAPPAVEAPRPEPVAAAPAPKAPVVAPLNLKSLEAGLKNTNAIGFFTKVEIRNQVGDLVDEFREVHQGQSRTTVSELRRDFDLLVLKVLALVQDGDPRLASQIAASRESLWAILSNPHTFANI